MGESERGRERYIMKLLKEEGEKKVTGRKVHIYILYFVPFLYNLLFINKMIQYKKMIF